MATLKQPFLKAPVSQVGINPLPTIEIPDSIHGEQCSPSQTPPPPLGTLFTSE